MSSLSEDLVFTHKGAWLGGVSLLLICCILFFVY